MITITASSNVFGESKQYIARITGRDPKFQLRREFVGRKTGKRNDTTEYSTDETGIYEDCDIDKKGRKDIGYWLVANAPATGELIKTRANLEDVLAPAKRLDAGERLEDMIALTPRTDTADPTKWTYSVRSQAEAKAAITGQTIETATEQCWQILQALPEREAKKVIAALKLRVSPPKPAAAPPIAETPAEGTPEAQ
jgi:hypothetical protein